MIAEETEMQADLSEITMPCLHFAGEGDANFAAVKQTARQIPHAEFVAFPGLTHAGVLFSPTTCCHV